VSYNVRKANPPTNPANDFRGLSTSTEHFV
jgi:hypothetical protein